MCLTLSVSSVFFLSLPYVVHKTICLARLVKMYSAWHITQMQLNGLNSLEQITVLFWVDYIYACLDHLFHEIKMA